MNEIIIHAPRWKDKTVLVADWKIGMKNKIVITAKRKDGSLYYPEPFIAWGEQLRNYPLEQRAYGKMRVVKLADLKGQTQWLNPGMTPDTAKVSSKKGSAKVLPGQLQIPGSESL